MSDSVQSLINHVPCPVRRYAAGGEDENISIPRFRDNVIRAVVLISIPVSIILGIGSESLVFEVGIKTSVSSRQCNGFGTCWSGERREFALALQSVSIDT